MYKKKSLLCVALLCVAVNLHAKFIVVDTIVEIVSSEHGTKLITQSDLDCPSLAGTLKTRENIRFESAVMLDAEKFSRVATDDDVEAYMIGVMKENNISRSDIRGLFGSIGYTYDEGLEELRKTQTISNMMGSKVHANVVISRKEIEAYYNAHPEYEPATYTIERAVVPAQNDVTDQEQVESLQGAIARRGKSGMQWSGAMTIEEKDLAEDKKFIINMEVGQFSHPKKIFEGFEVFHLVSKKPERLLTIEERYFEILSFLQQPRYEQLFAEYKNEMEQSVSVVHLTPPMATLNHLATAA